MTPKPPYVSHMQEDILIDLNVILDVLLERNGVEASQQILELNELRNYKLHISAHFVTTFAYLLGEATVPTKEIQDHIKWLIETFNVVPVDNLVLKNALRSHIKDYEDAVVEQTAILCKASTIITRNVKDFNASAISALKPEDYLKV
jgi:predicted nucleic-acid-binding protein